MQQFRKLKNALDCDTNGTRSVYQVGIPARMFVVASEREFYNKCISITVQQDRNFYEVIKADKPCHLHLDLDMDRTKYPSMSMSDVWEDIKKYIDGCIHDMQHEIEECIVLDSSNEKKGSYHIIYKLKDHIFASSANVGAFLRCLYQKRIKINPEMKLIWDAFVDMGIYTRNRLFRMLSCTKKCDPTRVLVWKDHRCTFETWRTCKVQPVVTSRDTIECEEPDKSPASYMSGNLFGTQNMDEICKQTLRDFTSTLGPVKRIFNLRRNFLYAITLESKFCKFKNDFHSKNTNYIIVDLLKKTYFYKCWSKKYPCKGCKSAKRYLPTQFTQKLDKLFNFTIDPSDVTNDIC